MGTIRRVVDAPLWVHAALLSLLLGLAVSVIGTQGMFSADEGAVIAQLDIIEEHGGFVAPLPNPDVDPRGEYLPLDVSTVTDDGWSPFPKHPLYVVLLKAAQTVGGAAGMTVLTMAAVVGTAAITNRLTRTMGGSQGAGLLAFWAVGLASPVAFYGHVLIAHAFGALFATAALLAALAIQRRLTPWLGLTLMALLLLVGVLLRSELTLFAIALGCAFGLESLVKRDPRLLLGSITALVSVVVARWLDGKVGELLVGQTTGSFRVSDTGDTGSFIGDRALGFVITTLLPSYGNFGVGDMLLVFSVIAATLAVGIAGRSSPDNQGVLMFSMVASAAMVGRVVVGGGPIPGLLFAFPFLPMAIPAIRRHELMSDCRRRITVVTVLLFAVGVYLTQYAFGGGGEWGGRYLSPLVPGATALLAIAAHDLWLRASLDRPARRSLALMSALMIIGVFLIGGRTLYESKRESVKLSDTIIALKDEVPDSAVVTTDGAVGRFAAKVSIHGEWFSAPSDGIALLADRLAASGIERVVLVWRGDRPPISGPQSGSQPAASLGEFIIEVLPVSALAG